MRSIAGVSKCVVAAAAAEAGKVLAAADDALRCEAGKKLAREFDYVGRVGRDGARSHDLG